MLLKSLLKKFCKKSVFYHIKEIIDYEFKMIKTQVQQRKTYKNSFIGKDYFLLELLSAKSPPNTSFIDLKSHNPEFPT